MKATQGALIRLERWSEYWCLPPNPSKCEACFFFVDPHQANLQPHLLFNSPLRFNPTPTFFRVVTFDRIVSFSKHVPSLKAKFFFLGFKALRCISASSCGPLRSPFLFCIRLFFGPFSLILHPDVFFSKRHQCYRTGTYSPSG